MQYSYKIATVNLNSTSTDVNKGLLRDFVYNHDIDIVMLQEVAYDNFLFIPTHFPLVNISEDNKGTAVLIRKSFNFKDVLLDPNGRIVSFVLNNINYVNIYAHSGSDKRRERNDLFTNRLAVHLNKPGTRFSVLCGDFNCILDGDDTRSNVKNFCAGLKNIIDLFSFKDIAKQLKKAAFTFIRGDSASRLDRFYGPIEFVNEVIDLQNIPVAFSDHHAVIIKVNSLKDHICAKGRGYWKINPSLLDSEEISKRFQDEYIKLKSRSTYNTDLNSWWHFILKPKIKQFYKTESWKINSATQLQKSNYLSELLKMAERQHKGENLTAEIAACKTKLMEIEYNRLNNYSKKLSNLNISEGEKISVFQVSKQINQGHDSQYLRLQGSDGIITEKNELDELIFQHFSKQFDIDNTSTNLRNEENPLDSISKSLDDDDREMMIDPITEEEILNILNACNKKKSPGIDGLTYEFYITHYDLIKKDLTKLLNGYLTATYSPPKEFTDGIVILIPKKGDNKQLENYRPITLLNTDHKLLTKIIAARIQEKMDKLIGPGQSACVKNLSCSDNLKDIRKMMTKAAETKRFKGFLLSLDLEKAFDRVNHSFLWDVLMKFGFPEQIINCVKKLYVHASSRVLYNGFLSKEFKIKASVRQGCPLSMLLFVLYIEPLIRRIYANTCGILAYDKILKVTAYADDLNVYVRNCEEFDLIIQIISSFSKFAKIRLNQRKSAFLRINNCISGPFLIPEADDLKILGVVFKNSWNSSIDQNYNKLVNDIKYRLTLNSFRKLSLVEKCWFVNSFVLSKLWYIAKIFPPKNIHLAKIKASVGNFIWNNQIFKVDRRQLYLSAENGGLGLQDPESKCKAIFIRNVLQSDCPSNDEYLLRYKYTSKLSRNSREWLETANMIKSNYNLHSCKLIYLYFIDEFKFKPKVEIEYPQMSWETAWLNLSSNFLQPEDRSSVYNFLNDLIPNRFKLFQYGIRKVTDNKCEICFEIDNNLHRLKSCPNVMEIRNWTEQILRTRMNVRCNDLEDILFSHIDKNSIQQKAALWITVHFVGFVFRKFPKCSLYVFKKSIRELRWNKRKQFVLHFGTLLNIC